MHNTFHPFHNYARPKEYLFVLHVLMFHSVPAYKFQEVTHHIKCNEGRLNGLDILRMNCLLKQVTEENMEEK
jgi:hypothetical protein